MSVEGVWKVEILSPNGWEGIGTAFLRKGRYLSASADHYAIGRYKKRGRTLKLDLHVTQHGKIRTLFGSKKKHLDLEVDGKIDKAGKIVGTSKSLGSRDFDHKVRLIRLGGLD